MRQFTFDLALKLGKTRRELLAGMDSRELSEWMAFFTLRNEQQEQPEENLEAKVKNEFEMYNIGVK